MSAETVITLRNQPDGSVDVNVWWGVEPGQVFDATPAQLLALAMLNWFSAKEAQAAGTPARPITFPVANHTKSN